VNHFTGEVLQWKPKIHRDDRGVFYESYNEIDFNKRVGSDVRFVQDNHSISSRGVIRGLHYQLPPAEQGKLVRVTRGSVFDVVVDLRRSSPYFGRWSGYELKEANHIQLWIPPGFAHGFMALVDGTEVQYKTTHVHTPDREGTIRWNDPEIGINWPIEAAQPIVSRRDGAAPPLAQAEIFD